MRASLGRAAIILSSVGVIVGVAACGSSSSSSAATGVSSASLAGKTFVSTQVTGHDLVTGTKVTLTFEAATLSASAGCNTMSAEYTVENSRLRWTGPPRSTLIGCDAALSAQDQWLAMFLQAGATASLTGSRLSLDSSPTVIDLQAQ